MADTIAGTDKGGVGRANETFPACDKAVALGAFGCYS